MLKSCNVCGKVSTGNIAVYIFVLKLGVRSDKDSCTRR